MLVIEGVDVGHYRILLKRLLALSWSNDRDVQMIVPRLTTAIARSPCTEV